MSKESLQKFAQKFEENSEWGNQFTELSTEELVAKANGEGFDFTVEEWDSATQESADGELSEDDLENVAGGFGMGRVFTGRFREFTRSLKARKSASFDQHSKHSVTKVNRGRGKFDKF